MIKQAYYYSNTGTMFKANQYTLFL